MKTIIEIAPLENGAHRTQRGDFNLIPDGWVALPDSLQEIYDVAVPFFDLAIEKGTLIAITPTTKPKPDITKPSDPTPEEKLRADVDYLAALQGVAL